MSTFGLHFFSLLMISTSFVFFASPDVFAQERTSENTPMLSRFLKRTPAADLDGDGVLTFSEARTYHERQSRKTSSEEPREPTRADVAYGPHPRQRFDFYRPEEVGETEKTPVLIFFHGGGFVGGDKSQVRKLPLFRACLENGISVVSGNYRFVKPRPGEPAVTFPHPVLDGARVVQYVRHQADAWHLDPERIAMSGGSAGGCMSCWIATHDDLADPTSVDPIARESSRLAAVVGYGAQTTLDPRVILTHIGGDPRIHSSLLPGFGVERIEELETPEMRQVVEEASALTHVSPDDPPMQLRYAGVSDDVPLPPSTGIGRSIHHPMFGLLMQKAYHEHGLHCEVVCEDLPATESEIDFLLRIFEKK
jgi:acetyl esterase/lipase